MSAKAKKRLRRGIAFLTISGAALVMYLLAKPPTTPLLKEKARLEVDLSLLRLKQGEKYDWLADHSLLIQSTVPNVNKWIWNLEQVDTRTWKRTRLVGLMSLFDKTKAFGGNVAPDGEWIEWFAGDLKEHVARLDGSRYYAWPIPHTTSWSGVWTANGNMWVCPYATTVNATTSTAGANINTPAVLDAYQLVFAETGRGGQDLKLQAESPVAHMECSLNGTAVLSGGIIRTAGTPGFFLSSGLPVYDLDSSRGMASVSHWTISLPSSFGCYSCMVSPDGQKVALVGRWNDESFLQRILAKVVPSLRKSGKPRDSLWISRFDGSNLREIGYAIPSNANESAINLLRWFPDSRSVGVAMDGKLWSVRVD